LYDHLAIRFVETVTSKREQDARSVLRERQNAGREYKGVFGGMGLETDILSRRKLSHINSYRASIAEFITK